MAKILGTTAISGNIAKMVELPDYLLINGQTYDKNTFSPNPFDFCPITSSPNNEMYLSQTAYVNSQWIRNRTSNNFILDNTDPSTCYGVTQATWTGNSATFYKLSKATNGWTVSNNTGWGTNYNPFMNIISQDTQKVYYTINRYVDGSYTYIGYFNKSNVTIGASVNLGNRGIIKVLKDTDMYIYFSCPVISGLTYNVGKYDKINNTVTWLMSDTLTSGCYWNLEASNIDSNGVFYCMRDGLGLGMTDHYAGFRKYVLDSAKDTVAISTVNVDYSLYPTGKILLTSAQSNGNVSTLLRYTDENTGKKYINLLITNGGNAGLYLSATDSALYTFEIIDADNWKFVSWTSFNPIIYKTFLPILNNQTIILAYENGCHIYSWDTGTASYKKVSSFDTSVMAVGTDSNNNIYIQYSDTSIEMISNVMPITMFADFENDTYNYNGVDITANVVAYVKNFQGKYLSSSIQLTLFGNCKFTDDGKRTKTITTSNLDKITIPVTIYDTGNLKVSIKVL